MRDKVKRFLSILMTALMLVNLLPVGALAEGVMISNSVQSRAQKPDGYPVFVFVEVQGNTDGLTMNSDKWFTLGMVKSMNDVTKPPKPVTGYQNNINGVTADDVTAAMTRYKPNESINLGGIRWKGFKSENGASDTYPAYTNQACWHLDGSIRIEDLQVDYTIRYVDENNKEIASSKKKTDKAGSWTKLEKEDIKDMPAGETVTAEATYTITSADILAGVFHNTVTADFTGGGSWTAEDTVTTAELNTTLNVTKTSDVPEGQKAALGQKITYTIKVQNAGNVPYTNVKVEDPLTKLTATIETLAVGETRTFTTEYVVTEADVLKGSVLNTATATGDKIKDPKSDEQKEPNGGDEVETPTFAPITIKPKDVTATYNGAAITGKDVEITSGKLLEGHKLSAAVIGSGVNAGSYELTLDPEKIKIVDANNKDVSEMYARTILPGKLIINKRSVLITSQSATKTYDGSALTRPAVTITGDGFVPGELAKAEATGSITKVGSTPNAIQYTTTGAFNAANYSIALSVGTLTVTEKPKPEPRRTFNLTISYVYQNGKRAAASYNRGGLKNGETFDITSPVIAGYTASETVVSGTIYNRDIKVTVIYTADGVNLDDYGVPLGLGNITMNVGDCFE